MVRMLALVGEAYGGGGGIAQYNRDLFDALSDADDWQVDILPRHGIGRVETPQAMRQHQPISDRPRFIFQSLQLAAQIRPQVIFCGHLFMAPLAAALAWLAGAKLIIQLHGIEAWPRPNALIRRSVDRADLVLCVSRDTRTRVLSWTRLPAERLVVASNTVGAAFKPSDRELARHRWGLGDAQVILSVGRLDRRERYKGQDRVIAALPEMISRGSRPLFLIAGDGDDRPRLEALAEEYQVSSHVRFLGQATPDELPDLYRAADLFALPSTGEGFGIVFLEAMACGTPALGLAAGGATDALGEGELGIVARAESLAQALIVGLATKPSGALVEAVQGRFGQEVFRRRIRAVLNRMRPEASHGA